jgi:dihydropteroate synthase
MGLEKPQAATGAQQRARASPSAPFVRVFASGTPEHVLDELRSIEVSECSLAARRALQVTVKLLVPSTWGACISQTVTAWPGLTLFASAPQTSGQALLLIGAVGEVAEFSHALALSEPSLAAVTGDILDQLRQIYPKTYNTLECGGRSVDFSIKTGIMGVLNVTPDSFSDGGLYSDLPAAVGRAHQMVAEGADIVDIGGQSSRPGSEPVSEAEERRRVVPVVEAVAKSVPAIISVDTYRAEIARAALGAGAHLINDISALRFDPALLGVVASHRAALILMHMQGMPRTMHLNPHYDALIDEVFDFLRQRLSTAQAGGVPAERLLIDPGIGFGKGARHNLELLGKLRHFQALGRAIVVGTSRKSFIGHILGVDVHERLEGTAATVATAIAQGADVIRVHDVQAMVRVARIMDVMVRPNAGREAIGQRSDTSQHDSSELGKGG